MTEEFLLVDEILEDVDSGVRGCETLVLAGAYREGGEVREELGIRIGS